jgi:hypothetical protein
MELSFPAIPARFVVQRQRVCQSYAVLEAVNIVLRSVQLQLLHSLIVVYEESGDRKTLTGEMWNARSTVFCHVSPLPCPSLHTYTDYVWPPAPLASSLAKIELN